MKFGHASLDEARGAIMAHSQRVGERMIRKGSLLDEAAIEALRAAGRTEVICARLEPGDVPEDIAADRLATPLVAPLIARSRAATGRVNLSAEVPGLLRVDVGQIDRLNSLDEAMTIGTLPDYAVVAPKDLIATIKIIPFAVAGTMLAVAETLLRQGPSPLSVHPFRHLKVGLVITELPGLKDSVTEKTIAITEARITALTGSLLPPVRCAHHEEPIGRALESSDRDRGGFAAGDRRLGRGGPAGCRAGGHCAGGRANPAFRDAGGPWEPDLPGADRDAAGFGAAWVCAESEPERDRFRADAAVRGFAGDAAGHDADGRGRAVEGDGDAADATGKSAGDAEVGGCSAQCAGDWGTGAGGGAVAADGAAQQAADRGSFR